MRALGVWKTSLFLLLIFAAIVWAPNGTAIDVETNEPGSQSGVAIVLDIQDAIGPATRDFLIRSLKEAEQVGAKLVVVRLDIPGGLDASTRDIIKAIHVALLLSRADPCGKQRSLTQEKCQDKDKHGKKENATQEQEIADGEAQNGDASPTLTGS